VRWDFRAFTYSRAFTIDTCASFVLHRGQHGTRQLPPIMRTGLPAFLREHLKRLVQYFNIVVYEGNKRRTFEALKNTLSTISNCTYCIYRIMDNYRIL